MTLGCKCCWDSPGLKLNSHQALAGLKKAKIEKLKLKYFLQWPLLILTAYEEVQL